MAAALDRFQKATSALLEIRAASDRMGAFDQGQPTESYRLIVEAVRTLQSGDFGAVKASVQMARNSRIALNGQRTEIFAKFLGTLETEAAESAEKAKKERFQKVTDRLVAVKEPADLDALASELARFAQESSEQTGRSNENWPQLAEHLTALATVWTSGSPVNWQRDVPGGSNSGIAAFSVPLRALRNRIERDLLVRALKIPELNSAPLSELPIETALDTLSDQLARNAEWRRLFQVLEARSNPQYPRGERLSDDALTGLRTFFAGQNYELAEQWGDAVTAYKEVLRTTSLRSPTAAAAERLKALSKAHPELGRPPAPTVPPPNVKKR